MGTKKRTNNDKRKQTKKRYAQTKHNIKKIKTEEKHKTWTKIIITKRWATKKQKRFFNHRDFLISVWGYGNPDIQAWARPRDVRMLRASVDVKALNIPSIGMSSWMNYQNRFWCCCLCCLCCFCCCFCCMYFTMYLYGGAKRPPIIT